MPSKTPLQDWKYLVSWWNTFGRTCPQTGRSGRLYVLLIRSDKNPIAIVPFFCTDTANFSAMPRRLRPFGYAGRLELYDLTEEPLIAIRPGFERAVIQITTNWLQEGLKRKYWDCCVMKWFGETDPTNTNRYWQRFTRKVGPAYVALPNDWKRFKKSLSRSMRDNLPYYSRLLTREGHDWQIEIADIGPDWQSALSDLIRLHRLRACASNDKNRVDHFSSAAHKDFFNAIHDAFRRNTRSFICILRIDGETAAAQLFLDDGKTMVLSYSGYDPRWSRYSPLLILQSEMIQQAISRGIQRLDLLCGEAQWQERWQPTRDFPINKLVLASKRPIATIRCINYVVARELLIYWGKSRFARWLKRTRASSSLQSCGQALYLGLARHAHLLNYAHRLRCHF